MNLTLDINTVLTSLVLAGLVWIIRTNLSNEKRQASAEATAVALDDKVKDHGQRLNHVEHEVGALKVEVAKISSNDHA